MAQGFYQLLGIDPEAEPEEIRDAYQRRLAELVRRLRVARQQGADVSILESQERAVREAMDVLSDPARRRSYDAYRHVVSTGDLPTDAEQLWVAARGGMVDPLAGIALAAVRSLTALPVGNPLPDPPPGYSQKQTWSVDLSAPAPEPGPELLPGGVTPHDDIQVEPAAAPDPAAEGAALPPAPARPAAATEAPPSFPQVEQELTITDPRLGFGAPLPAPQHDLVAEAPPLAVTPEVEPKRGAGLLGKLAAFAAGAADRGARIPSSAEVGRPVWDDDLVPAQDLSQVSDPVERLRLQHGEGGGFLRAVREHRGLSLDALARSTRISSRYLSALEDEAFDRLPSTTFVRGYLRQVVQVLELEDRDVVDAYMNRYTSQRA